MAKKMTIDFSSVKDVTGINPKHVEEGDYAARITGVIDKPAKDDTPMWCFIITPDDFKSASYPYYCKLQENQLWKLRNLILATGMAAPKKKMQVDPDRLVGKAVAITLSDDEYEGKMKSVIDAVFPVTELDGTGAPQATQEDAEDDEITEDEDDVIEDAPEPEEAAEADEEDEEEDDEDEAPAGDEYDAMDRAALRKALRNRNLDGAKKSESDDDLRNRLRAADAASGDDEDEEDEIEEADDEIDLDAL